mgnify:CR=1 FL=1
MADRYLILEDGSAYLGEGFGSPAVSTGEIVVNTSMTGYQEIITNQIYRPLRGSLFGMSLAFRPTGSGAGHWINI